MNKIYIKPMSRRQFIGGSILIAASSLSVNRKSHAIAPIIAGGLKLIAKPAGKLLASLFGKGAVKAVATSLKTASGKKIFITGAKTLNILSTVGGVYWIMSSFDNKAGATIINHSNDPISAKLTLGIKDVETGKIELEHDVGIIEAESQVQAELDFLFQDLPYSGKKIIYGYTDNKSIEIVNSEPFLVIPNNKFCTGDNCKG